MAHTPLSNAQSSEELVVDNEHDILRDGQLYDATVRQLYLDSSGGGKVEVLWHGEASVDWVDVDHLQQHSKCGTVLYCIIKKMRRNG